MYYTVTTDCYELHICMGVYAYILIDLTFIFPRADLPIIIALSSSVTVVINAYVNIGSTLSKCIVDVIWFGVLRQTELFYWNLVTFERLQTKDL